MTEIINGTSKTYSYTYNEDNRLTSMTVDGVTVEYTYDGFGQLATQTTKQGDTVILTEQTGYKDTDTTASTQVTNYNGFAYTYDDNGNILSISDGTNTTSYVYDSQNQLIRENNQARNYTHTWTYDNAGNILSRKEYTYTLVENLQDVTPTDIFNYEYEDDNGNENDKDDWGDLLTSYDGRTITYDGIGNPLNDEEWTYSWKHGRQLVSMSDGTTTWNYTYNADNLRTKRTNGTYTYSYVYSGSQLAMMSKGNDTLYFTYDASGVPLAVKYNGTTYYYKTNLQGDIIAIVDSTGTAVVTYEYDAWGVLLDISGTMKDTLGTINPLTYRGYVYDRETGLYYLQSRYYNPEWGRFINADILVSTKKVGIGCNIFAYCNNNTVNYCDKNGFDAIWIQESESAEGNGHSGLMVQDEEGNWFFFFWGPTDETSDKDLIFGTKNGSYIQEIPTNGADLHDIEVLRSTLAAAGGKAGNRANAITDIYYFKGDYTATLDAVENMVNMNEEYNLITNNCVQKTIDAFSASDSRFSMVAFGAGKYLIPNWAASKVAMLPSNKKSFPWKLFFYNMLLE